MSEQEQDPSAVYLAQYLRNILEAKTAGAQGPDGQPIHSYGAGHIAPAFWADAPWRLEPDTAEIPFTFIIRDAAGESIRMRLTAIEVYEAPDDGQPWETKQWKLVRSFSQGLGEIALKFWTYRPSSSVPPGPPPRIPLSQFKTAVRGRPLCLKVVFKGSRLRPILGRRRFEERRYLSVFLASESLPLRHTAQWYYGDTHLHTSYTSDVKEFGNPVPDTRAAGECIGLDWLVTTDHSCDLADGNPYWEEKLTATRWDDLGLEVQANSDDRLRLLRGEEVTALGIPGSGDDTLHLLVMGTGLTKMIPGAWATRSLLAKVAASLSEFAQDLYEHLFGPIYSLDALLTGLNQAGQTEPALAGLSVQAQGALAFAAHPATSAQAPGGTWEYYDLLEPIQGVEAWNGRLRRVAADEQKPFDGWRASGDWDTGPDRQGIQTWDRFLQRKCGGENPRFVLLAGSDAHGSFNYSEGWWMDWTGFRADDNTMGGVRTLLYLPHRVGARRAPTEAEVIEAIGSGSCVVTDGPAVNLTLGFDGVRATLGQSLALSGDGPVEVFVQAASTAEFGMIEQVEVCYFVQGMTDSVSKLVSWHVGQSTEIDGALPSGPGYVRLAVTTHRDEEVFRCFTNPVWIRPTAPGRRSLRVSCIDW